MFRIALEHYKMKWVTSLGKHKLQQQPLSTGNRQGLRRSHSLWNFLFYCSIILFLLRYSKNIGSSKESTENLLGGKLSELAIILWLFHCFFSNGCCCPRECEKQNSRVRRGKALYGCQGLYKAAKSRLIRPSVKTVSSSQRLLVVNRVHFIFMGHKLQFTQGFLVTLHYIQIYELYKILPGAIFAAINRRLSHVVYTGNLCCFVLVVLWQWGASL